MCPFVKSLDHETRERLYSRFLSILPWLNLFGAVLGFVLISLFAAIHSDLAKEISTGESPAFSWARTSMPVFLLIGLAFFSAVFWVQRLELRRDGLPYRRATTIMMWAETVAVAVLATGFLRWWAGGVFWGHVLFQVSILAQALLTLWRSKRTELHHAIAQLSLPERQPFLFLFFLFFLGGMTAYFDPSWNRMEGYIHLDTGSEILLSRVLPPVLSGITALWFGIGTLAILTGFRVLTARGIRQHGDGSVFFFLPFFSISGLYSVIWLESLIYATEWELKGLHLKAAIIPLFILLCGGGGLLLSAAFQRIASHGPQGERRSQIGMITLSMGAVPLFPLTWILTREAYGRWSWRILLLSCLFSSLFLGLYVLYGDLFDPWFTAFSYLKGAILKSAVLVAAGILVLVAQELFSGDSRIHPRLERNWIVVGMLFFTGFVPFGLLERYGETKVAVFQFNELSRVDAAYARGLSNAMGVGRWIRLGQNPDMNRNPEPWPLPWILRKTRPSLLPKDFNIIVVVVDALRGDAFHSAGYRRNLTPFLDRWAFEDAISFRRAYSQGGGSFSAFPFLVGGRSRFNLYGPDIYRENLYFKLAQAEGIQKIMVGREFGPRAIFPPDFPVIELGRSEPSTDRRSVSADEVFGWTKDAIDKLPEGERFLSFIHLMDVHNDLWKKEGGLDFGDSPRDLYDNNLSYVDRAFERFVAWLREKGIYERTVILLTSDHGEQFWEHGASLHGHTLYEEEIRTPLILLVHGIRKRVEDVPVVAADMAPTLVDLAGYDVDPPYDDTHMGISLVPLLLRNEQERYLKRDIVGRASFKRRYFLYRNWEWKLVYLAELDLLQLFNTREDPMERRNLLVERPHVAVELERELLDYLEKVERKTYRPLLSRGLK